MKIAHNKDAQQSRLPFLCLVKLIIINLDTCIEKRVVQVC